MFLARFEISVPEIVMAGRLERLGSARKRVRCSFHEPSTRIVPTSCLPPPLRTRSPRRLPDRALRVRSDGIVPPARLLEPVRLSAPGTETLPSGGALQKGRGQVGREVPGGGRAASGWTPLHDERGGTGAGHDRGESGRGSSAVLPLLEAGGEGGGGGNPAGGCRPAESSGHRDPVQSTSGSFGRGSSPRRTSHDPPRPDEDLRGAAHGGASPVPRYRVEGVSREAEEGEVGPVARAALRHGRAGAGGGAGSIARRPGEEEEHGSREGEAGGEGEGSGRVPVAARFGRGVRLGGAGGDRPRRPSRAGRTVDGGELSSPLQGPQPGSRPPCLRRRAHGSLHPERSCGAGAGAGLRPAPRPAHRGARQEKLEACVRPPSPTDPPDPRTAPRPCEPGSAPGVPAAAARRGRWHRTPPAPRRTRCSGPPRR